MQLFSTERIEGRQIEMLGLVQGSTIQSKNMFKDIGQGFKTMVGGELVSYTKMMNEAREISVQRMIEQAATMGANAIVGVRFASSAIMQGAAEIMVYGTAVRYI